MSFTLILIKTSDKISDKKAIILDGATIINLMLWSIGVQKLYSDYSKKILLMMIGSLKESFIRL